MEQIFAWRTDDHLGTYAIARRLAADPDAYPAPDPAIGWTPQVVWQILRNPKYTGHMVYGRRRKINGKTRPMPPAQWIWSAQPVHPEIVTRATWDAAQAEGSTHATSPDDPRPAPGRRTYLLRSRVRCRACTRRMYGATRTTADGQQVTWYLCPHSPNNPRHTARTPDHPRAVLEREDKLLAAITQFCHERVLGPDRAALLAADTPATAAADQARKNRETARLTKRLKMIDAFEDAHTAELEALITAGAAPAALTALRTRHIKRFTELEAERADITARRAALTTNAPRAVLAIIADHATAQTAGRPADSDLPTRPIDPTIRTGHALRRSGAARPGLTGPAVQPQGPTARWSRSPAAAWRPRGPAPCGPRSGPRCPP